MGGGGAIAAGFGGAQDLSCAFIAPGQLAKAARISRPDVERDDAVAVPAPPPARRRRYGGTSCLDEQVHGRAHDPKASQFVARQAPFSFDEVERLDSSIAPDPCVTSIVLRFMTLRFMAGTARPAALGHATGEIDMSIASKTPYRRSLRGIAVAALLATTLLTTACVTESTYGPATGRGFERSGYSDRQIEENRFQVSFSGNSYTSRDTVEKYLLYRAAELTVQRGFDYFILADRDVDKKSRTYTTPGIGGGYGYGFGGGYWGPSWRYRGRGFGWRSWDPFWGDPFFDRGIDVNTIDKYEANAEIVVGRGPKPASNIKAFDAHEVIRNLGPSIVTPK